MKTFKPGQQQQPQARGDIEVGDDLYVHHEGQPCTGCVVAHGRHGVTVKVGDKHHKLKWDKVLGHKTRAQQRYDVIEQGEDGMLVQDSNGRRRYVAIPNDSKEDPMVAKSFGRRPVLLFMKAGGAAPGPGLAKKQITDKNGVQTTRWVSTSAGGPPAQHGQHVGFANGEHRGHGQVSAAGKDGVTVKDGAGGAHRVPHDKITHHWQGDGAPDASPHEPSRPDWAARNEGENDKAYAKRVVDKGEAVNSLPEQHERYFNTEGSTHVSLDNLHSTKSDDENQQGGDNGPKRMLAAYHGELGKRDPITVMPHESKDGHFEVVDGNGTLTSAKNMGWKGLPTKVVSRDLGQVLMLEDKLKDQVKDAGMHELFSGPDTDSLPAKVASKFKTWADLSDAGAQAQKDFEKLMNGVADALSAKNVGDLGSHDMTQPGIVFGIGPMKTEESASRKVNSKYGGDFSKLGDLVRGSIGFDSVDQLKDGIEKLKAAGLKLATKPDNKFIKPTDAGYRDMNLNFEMPNGVVGELQLHLKPILNAKSEGHKDYEMTRLLDAKAKNDPPLTDEESADLDRRLLKQRSLYGNAMKSALEGLPGSSKKMIKSTRSGMILLFGKVVM